MKSINLNVSVNLLPGYIFKNFILFFPLQMSVLK